MFTSKFAFAGIAGAVIMALSASDAKAQFVQFGTGYGYGNPYVGNVYRGNSFYSPYNNWGGYNNSYYNRGSYYGRPYYGQPYYGGRNYYNNGYNRNRGSGLFFNFGFRR